MNGVLGRNRGEVTQGGSTRPLSTLLTASLVRTNCRIHAQALTYEETSKNATLSVYLSASPAFLSPVIYRDRSQAAEIHSY